MIDAVLTMLPIFAFMLIPVFIPLVTSVIGGLADAVRAASRPQRARD